MRPEPVDVPGERAREPEEPHGDDRDGQREDGGSLRGARDQVPGGRHQPDAEQDRQGAEHDGDARRGSRASPTARAAGGGGSSRDASTSGVGRLAILDPHDAVAVGGELGTMGDQQQRAATPEPSIAAATSSALSRVEVRGRLVEDRRAGRRGGTPGRARACAPARPRAAGRRRRRPSRSRPAAPRRSRRRRRARQPPALVRIRRRGSARRMLSATVPAEQRRPLRHPGELPPPRLAARSPRGRARPRELGPPSARRAGGAARRSCSSRRRSARRARPSRPAPARGRPRRARDAGGPDSRTRRCSSRIVAVRRSGLPAAARDRDGGGASMRSSSRPATAAPSALAWNCAATLRIGR